MSIDYLVKDREKPQDSKKKTSYLILPLPNQYFFADTIDKKTDQKGSKDYKPIYSGLMAYNPYSSPYGLLDDRLNLNPNKKPQEGIPTFNQADKYTHIIFVSELEKMTILTYLRPTHGGVQEEREDRDFKTTIIEENRRKELHILLFKKREEEQLSYQKKKEDWEKKRNSKETEEYKRMVCKYLN